MPISGQHLLTWIKYARSFSLQHLADQKLADREREGYTLLLGMRSWEFAAFAKLRR